MKYAIRGKISKLDEVPIVTIVNQYTLWKFQYEWVNIMLFDKEGVFLSFEVWLADPAERDSLFLDLKDYIEEHGESGDTLDWHECTHDEPHPEPCAPPEEVYTKV